MQHVDLRGRVHGFTSSLGGKFMFHVYNNAFYVTNNLKLDLHVTLWWKLFQKFTYHIVFNFSKCLNSPVPSVCSFLHLPPPFFLLLFDLGNSHPICILIPTPTMYSIHGAFWCTSKHKTNKMETKVWNSAFNSHAFLHLHDSLSGKISICTSDLACTGYTKTVSERICACEHSPPLSTMPISLVKTVWERICVCIYFAPPSHTMHCATQDCVLIALGCWLSSKNTFTTKAFPHCWW